MLHKSVRTITVAMALMVTASAAAHPMPERTRTKELYFAHRCNENTVAGVKACVHRAAIHWGVKYSDGRFIADRETHFDPNICNSEGSGACGLFQFKPGTWASTPYGSYDVFDARYNALAWAWAWHEGWYSAWGF